ncbi:hypothetical protein Marpi_0433 [Marinitoga piezophila KA3]|uniref:Integral membrane protein n=1 Tax=Marinitoga piezophila (strain DSM 14283 / JCM 11233 / KA3) TaxID=443254 RepID=H2J4U2_MARPK|nr:MULTISPECIES: lysylphosphatidylglycerol synthase transmembrane domain-containing protein [Marinitoga]AEX84877.1 hypothetical protein Marpi_0433 [Marinitoga piezophila KA3]APT75381.1 hypothetical protein LN42_02510 [Marinitoga sp. 1137]
MLKKYKNLISLIISIFIAIFTIVMIEKLTDANLLHELKKLKIEDIMISFFIYFIGYFIDTIRYKIIIRQFGTKISFFQLFYNNVMGLLFSSLTPFAAGGQPYQIYHLNKYGLDLEHSTNIVISRFITLMFLNLFIAFISYNKVIYSLKNTNIESILINMGLFISVAITILILTLFLNSKWILKILNLFPTKRIKKLKSKFEKWSSNLKESISFLWSEKLGYMIIDISLNFLVLIVQAFSLFYMFYKYTNIEINLFNFWIVLGAMTLLNMVVYYIPTPGASGSIEASYQLVFSSILSIKSGVLISIIGWRFATYYLQILFASLLRVFVKLFFKEVEQ